MTPPEFSRRGQVASFLAMDVFRRAHVLEQSGLEISHLEVGQPATKAPQAVLDAAREALDNNLIGYTDALGLDRLRHALQAHYKTRYRVDVEANRFVITTGSSAGFVLAFLACLDAGQSVGVASPGYPAYVNIISSLNLKPVNIPLNHDNNWTLSVDDLKNAERKHGPVDALLIASPANPTGTMLPDEALASLAEDCSRAGRWFFSDEIYHGLTYHADASTALGAAAPDRLVVINSFSKYFSMTGWRIGWMVVPDNLVRSVERLQQNLFIAAPTLSQHAACAALTEEAGSELRQHVALYHRNRDVLLDCLKKNGISETAPADGAFYLYADLRSLPSRPDSEQFCSRLLEQAQIAVTPGIDFDRAGGGNFVRLSYARSAGEIDRAVERLNDFLPGFR